MLLTILVGLLTGATEKNLQPKTLFNFYLTDLCLCCWLALLGVCTGLNGLCCWLALLCNCCIGATKKTFNKTYNTLFLNNKKKTTQTSCKLSFMHLINRNAHVLARSRKLTRFEPAQYWGGGPPGNRVALLSHTCALFCFVLLCLLFERP